MRIYHNSRDTEYREPFGAVPAGTKLMLAVDVSECVIEDVSLEIWKDGSKRSLIAMQGEGKRYSTEIVMPDDGCLIWYRFAVSFSHKGVTHTVYYGNNSSGTGGEGKLGNEAGIGPYQITVYKPYELPSWYEDAVVYQIFPDRFSRDEGWRDRCRAANEKINARRSDIRRIEQEDWDRRAYYERNEANDVSCWPIYGGSLRGIEEKLDYLKSLGVTAIYLNPIFEATSNHRYDTGDYSKIDPALGTEDDFVSLASSARERGIRIFLDGVFSHTGCDSIYFDRYGNYPSAGHDGDDKPKGAWVDPDSPYRSWYRFDEGEACGYKSWWGVADLPEVDEDNSSYREFILGEDGIVASWMKLGASGWRLDVADELPDSFIEETRRIVKETDPEGLLIGEVWEDASNKISYGERRRYLLGDELDGTMNYPLRDILLDYVNYTIGSGFAADRLMCLRENYPEESFYGALNLIGSHDRERILTAMAGEQDHASAVRKVKLLSTLQYALPGVPCIYYGDEAGLMGGKDPENRGGYPWGHENQELLYHYRMLGLIYDEHPALKGGEFELLSGSYGIDDDIFAFIRSGKDAAGTEEKILVLANRSYGENDVDLSHVSGLRGAYALELLTSDELPLDKDGSLGVLHMEKLSVMMISIRDIRPETGSIQRDCGVICHISSLGMPKLGRPAKDFADYLESAGFGIWQVLPLNPAGVGGSPYSSYAAFAGEPGFINRGELPFLKGFEEFKEKNSYWLDDYIAFTVCRESNDDKPWYEWPDELKFGKASDILASLTAEQKARADELAGEQYYFDVQWKELREYANSKGILMMGDLPMFMAADSADVWANKSIFRMDEHGVQKVHAGVPPDAFSGEGQDWSNPLFDWDELARTGYDWWLRRLRQCAERFDILRIDHFRGFSEYYAIPEGGEPKDGRWQHGPGIGFIEGIIRMLRSEGFDMKILAEDLGFLDAGVMDLIKLSGLPGMDVWQFSSFEMMGMSAEEPEKAANRVFYTGTHDNDTLAGWLEAIRPDQSEEERENEAKAIITKIYESPACLAMLQIQDVFMLGSDARMNVPGVAEGNWTWRMPGDSVEDAFPDAAERAAFFKTLAAGTKRTKEPKQ